MLLHHYRYAYSHQTSLPLQALVPVADDVTKFQSRFLTDANASVRSHAASLLRLLVPLADADLLVSCVPALLRCIEMVTAQTQSSARGRTNTCSSSNSDHSTRAKVDRSLVVHLIEFTYGTGPLRVAASFVGERRDYQYRDIVHRRGRTPADGSAAATAAGFRSQTGRIVRQHR